LYVSDQDFVVNPKIKNQYFVATEKVNKAEQFFSIFWYSQILTFDSQTALVVGENIRG